MQSLFRNDKDKTTFNKMLVKKSPNNANLLKKSLKPGDSPGSIFKLPDGKLMTFSKNEKGKTAPKDFDELNCWTKPEPLEIKGGEVIEKIRTMTTRRALIMEDEIVKKERKLEKAKLIAQKTHEKIKKIKKMAKKEHPNPKHNSTKTDMTLNQIKELNCLKKKLSKLQVNYSLIKFQHVEYDIKVRTIERKIKKAKIKANKDSTCYLKKHRRLNKNTNKNFDRCIDHKLSGFKDSIHIQDLCTKMFGEDVIINYQIINNLLINLQGSYICVGSQNFCNMCCNHHIGKQFEKERYSCLKKCSDVINE